MAARTPATAKPGAPDVLGLLAAPLTVPLVAWLLRTVIDPELGVNILDLGLLYDIEVQQTSGEVMIAMTLTTPGCPLSGFLDRQIQDCLMALPQVRRVTVELVWEPAWGPGMMSEDARAALAWP